MNTVFDPISKRNFRAKNRLVRSATWMAQADSDGRPNDRCVETYRKLSEGGVGTIITEGVYIYSYPGDEADHAFRMTDDRWITDYQRISDAIHSSGALAIMQILYLQCKRKNIFNEWKPCAVDNMTDAEIKTVIQAHVDAAVRARKAGFDGVEIHAAHGFLLSQFLSGAYNHRSDRYGRDRKRLVMDIYRKIRRATSPGFAIWIKINSTDYVPDGMTQEECVRDATFFSDRGMDAIEISANEPSHPKVRIGVDESYFQNTAAMLKKMAAAPVILTGGNRTVQTMNDLMNRYGIDAFGMSRPLISEPDLPEKWMKSRAKMKTPRCISCNACFRTKYHQCVLR